jgi:hypothetical protein
VIGYVKLIIQLVGAAALWLAVYTAANGHVDTVGWIQFAIGLTGAVAVWMTANLPRFPYGKTIASAVTVVLNLVITLLARDGHLGSADVAQLVVAALTTLGVYAFPNTPTSPATTH